MTDYLTISEYTQMEHAGGQGSALVPLAVEPCPVEQNIIIGVGSVQSAALNANTSYVRVHADVACAIKVGTNPTANVAGCKHLSDGQTEYFGLDGTAALKIAVISL